MKIFKMQKRACRVILDYNDFCNIVWAISSESNKMKFFKMQKRACRVILDYNVDDSLEAFHSLKILSVYDRLFLRKAKFMYKVYHGYIFLKTLSSEMKWICLFT